MLLNNQNLLNQIEALNRVLTHRPWPSRQEVRAILEPAAGTFHRVKTFTPEEAAGLLKERPLVAVDGSYQTVGATYPYLVTFCQAHARALAPNLKDDKGITLQKLFTPLQPEDRAIIEAALEKGESPEVAALRNTKQVMTALEVETAIAALNKYRPAYLLLDGGFVQYLLRVKDSWETLVKTAEDIGCIVVGVIEEVSSHILAGILGNAWGWSPNPYDRELLYGILEVGEWFEIAEEHHAKYGFRTVFVRLASHPQAIGLDFLPSQADKIKETIEFLATMTPAHGRGIPAWLDVVDRYVRLTDSEIEQLLAVGLDTSLKEKLLTPHRQRRGL